jgi:hypothetical protein
VRVGPEERAIYVRLVERTDLDSFVESLVELFRSEIPAYAALPEPILQGQVREAIRRSIDLFLHWIEEGREPTSAELDVLRASAANRASEGLALPDVLHAYRVGARQAWSMLTDVAATADERDALLRVGWLMMDHLDRVSSAAASGYLAARQHDVSEDARRSRELLERLCGTEPVEPPLREFARSRGFALLDAYRPFALAVSGAPAHLHSQLAASLRLAGTLALTEGNLVVGLAAPEATGASLRGRDKLLALGRPAERARLAAALDETRFLLALALASGRMRGEVDARDHLLELLLHGAAGTSGLLEEHVLAPLERSERMRRLDPVATLQAYVDCRLDRRRAAQRLGVHPNTLDHRLARIAEASGIDVSAPAL